MAPINNSNRKLMLIDSDLPSADPKSATIAPPCSPAHKYANFLYQTPGYPKQAHIDGEVWPPIFKAEHVRGSKLMRPRDGDVFVCTYPKCGTTWVQHICSQLASKNYGPKINNELCVTSPMIERMGAKFADGLESPRLFKTHFNWKNLPKSSQAKYIYVVRNPKDCLTSYFHHNRNFKIYNYEHGQFSNFFNLFLSDNISFGNYFTHLKSWLPHIGNKNVLFLKYEDMCHDLRGAIIKIGKFLGGDAAEMVADPTTLASIVHKSTIDSMKKDQWRWFPSDSLHSDTFVRKGGSRNWKNHMTREQSDRIDAEFKRHFRDTVVEKWWKAEMQWENEVIAIGNLTLTDDDDLNASGTFTNSVNNDSVRELDDDLFDTRSNILAISNPSQAIIIPFRSRQVCCSSPSSLSSDFGSMFSHNCSLSSSPLDKSAI